jgi:membrane-bound ClpP family serine protease
VFDGERVDVVTAGEFIGQGQPVTVVLVEGGRVVVSGQEV